MMIIALAFSSLFLFLPVLADYYVSALMRAASRASWAPTPLNPKRKVKTTRKVIKTSRGSGAVSL